jgi:Arc/MetJ-type ribon-helix-helix transcriptional regulator
MSSAKIAISLSPKVLREVDRLVRAGRFPSRSKLLQDALDEKLLRIDRSRLARECAKLEARKERDLANETMRAEQQWPVY